MFMSVIGYILIWAGFIAWTIGNFRFSVVIFRYSTGWFFASMWIPLADWVCFFLYMKQTWKPMLIGTLGFVAMAIGTWMSVVTG
jgi:hypothetical protein